MGESTVSEQAVEVVVGPAPSGRAGEFNVFAAVAGE
jgi:hypothetical protein